MENKVDQIVNYSKENNAFTKECIKQAFIKLALKKDYREISVTELCKKAGVSRMAFYRNYKVVSDIIEEFISKIKEDIIKIFNKSNDIKNFISAVLEYIKLNENKMKLLFSKYFKLDWLKSIINTITKEDKSIEKNYKESTWCEGFKNIISTWLNNDFKETVEEITYFCTRFLPRLKLKTA